MTEQKVAIPAKDMPAGGEKNTFFSWRGKLRPCLAVFLVFLVCSALQINFVIGLLLIVLYAYLKSAQDKAFLKSTHVLAVTLLLVIGYVVSHVIIWKAWSVFYIPFALIPMLSIILFGDLLLSLLVVLAESITVSSIPVVSNYYLMILVFISGLSAVLLARDVRKRVAVIRAGFIIGIIQVVSLYFIAGTIRYYDKYLTLFFNGIVTSFIVLATLPLFEILFKTVTDIRLLELTDPDHPLLKRLMQEAPGTHLHSLVVGNLSDAACNAVGAHALLARLGAYYHDVGKLAKPEYFSENQSFAESKHDSLSPTMSKLVIMNHVREGVELAKKHKLPQGIVDFIEQHHGDSLVYYFYRRALEELEEDEEIREEGFRYPGPRPKTKEAAIVLLADSVEAAARALQDPTHSKIEELVHKVINNKFIDGQLNECNLTLRELEKIAAVFIHILSGICHSRITYPESESNNKKSTKENSYQSQGISKDKKGNS